jgi:hypothetical protein
MRLSIPSVVVISQERANVCMAMLKKISEVWASARELYHMFESILEDQMWKEGTSQEAVGQSDARSTPDHEQGIEECYDHLPTLPESPPHSAVARQLPSSPSQLWRYYYPDPGSLDGTEKKISYSERSAVYHQSQRLPNLSPHGTDSCQLGVIEEQTDILLSSIQEIIGTGRDMHIDNTGDWGPYSWIEEAITSIKDTAR